MGLGGKGKQVLYQCTGLSRVDIADIARGLVRNDSAGRPVIDVDANNFICVQSRASVDPVSHAAAALKEWSRKGLVITPVCDGSTRPQSKQQSNLNRAIREKSRCDAILARQQLRLLSQKADPNEQDALLQQELERKIKAAETQW